MKKDPGGRKKAKEAQAEGKDTASSQQPAATDEPSVASGGTTAASVDAHNGDIGGKIKLKKGVEEEEYDPHYEPIIHLPLVDAKPLEEDEETLWSARARLLHFADKDPSYVLDRHPETQEWKEKGVGDIKFLKHTEKGSIRLLMRRDTTLKLIANHYVYPQMALQPYRNCNRTLTYTTMADYSGEEPKGEVLAIRFKTPEICRDFAKQFENAKKEVTAMMTSSRRTLSASRAYADELDDEYGVTLHQWQTSIDGPMTADDNEKNQAVSVGGGGDVAGGVAEGFVKLALSSAAGDKATAASRRTLSASRAYADELDDEYGVTLHQWQTSIDGPTTADDTAK